MTREQTTQASIYCRHCGYQLFGLSENRCPECGQPFDPTNRRTYRKSLRRWTFRRVAGIALAVALLYFLSIGPVARMGLHQRFQGTVEIVYYPIVFLMDTPVRPAIECYLALWGVYPVGHVGP